MLLASPTLIQCSDILSAARATAAQVGLRVDAPDNTRNARDALKQKFRVLLFFFSKLVDVSG
jgi:hypothetical protein